MNIFSLTGIEQLYEDEANVDFVSKRRITRHQVGFYTTLEAAEAAMRDWLKLVRHWGWSIFGCEITEHALDEKVDLEKRDYGNIQSMRTYLDTGELNASVDCDTAGVKWFCGRTEPAKIAPGLLAWCLGRDSVELVLVVAKPPTREEWTKKPTGARRFWVASDRGDFSDDAYTVVNKEGAFRPLTHTIFPSDCEIALPPKGEAEYRAALFKVAKGFMPTERYEEMMNKTLVYEMVPYWSESTGLPVRVWIDEMRTNERGLRSKRIAFQLDKSDEQHPENIASMDFDGNVYPSDADLGEVTRKDLQQLRNFVRNNRYALERICEMDAHLETTWEFLIKGGEKAPKEKIEALNRKVDELIAAYQAIETSSVRARQKGLRGLGETGDLLI